jgi:hypothetical protein
VVQLSHWLFLQQAWQCDGWRVWCYISLLCMVQQLLWVCCSIDLLVLQRKHAEMHPLCVMSANVCMCVPAAGRNQGGYGAADMFGWVLRAYRICEAVFGVAVRMWY